MDPACQDACDTLKDGLTKAPVLAIPKNEGLFVLDTDASDVAVGGGTLPGAGWGGAGHRLLQ